VYGVKCSNGNCAIIVVRVACVKKGNLSPLDTNSSPQPIVSNACMKPVSEKQWIIHNGAFTSIVAACTRRARELFSPLVIASTMTKSQNPWWIRDRAAARPVGPAPTINVQALEGSDMCEVLN